METVAGQHGDRRPWPQRRGSRSLSAARRRQARRSSNATTTRSIRTDVELQHEKNPRQNGSCQHVEITCRTRGPVVRSEACAEDFYKALDLAADRLERRFRQAADRRRIHHGRRTPPLGGRGDRACCRSPAPSSPTGAPSRPTRPTVEPADEGPGRIVREKEHTAKPMTVDQALFEMELVGHDFYLFNDADTGRPSVVYRRHAYDYGLIRLASRRQALA